MLHKPAEKSVIEKSSKKKASLGIWFFFIYLFFYAGFVLIGVLNYDLLAIEVFADLNMALVYGIGLIVFAVLLGILYNYFCSRYEDELNTEETEA